MPRNRPAPDTYTYPPRAHRLRPPPPPLHADAALPPLPHKRGRERHGAQRRARFAPAGEDGEVEGGVCGEGEAFVAVDVCGLVGEEEGVQERAVGEEVFA